MILNTVLNIEELTKEEIVFLLSLKDEMEIEKLISRADDIRKEYCGDEIHLRGIINFSNNCEQDCIYCGLRISNFKLKRYRMNKAEILKAAEQIANSGVQTIVLQSGEDFKYDCNFISDLVKTIKRNFDLAITLSLGERGFFEYDEWLKAGADRYLLKHETANPNHYFKLHNKQSLDERILHLRYLKAIGFQTGSGNIIGLPGQTIEDIADDILLCKELDCDMASYSPFVASRNTPFKKINNADLKLTLKTIAVARIVLRNVHIPATTALSVLDEDGRKLGLLAGANVIMPDYTPEPYSKFYEIYSGKKSDPVIHSESLAKIKLMIKEIGRKISSGKGDSLKVIGEESLFKQS